MDYRKLIRNLAQAVPLQLNPGNALGTQVIVNGLTIAEVRTITYIGEFLIIHGNYIPSDPAQRFLFNRAFKPKPGSFKGDFDFTITRPGFHAVNFYRATVEEASFSLRFDDAASATFVLTWQQGELVLPNNHDVSDNGAELIGNIVHACILDTDAPTFPRPAGGGFTEEVFTARGGIISYEYQGSRQNWKV